MRIPPKPKLENQQDTPLLITQSPVPSIPARLSQTRQYPPFYDTQTQFKAGFKARASLASQKAPSSQSIRRISGSRPWTHMQPKFQESIGCITHMTTRQTKAHLSVRPHWNVFWENRLKISGMGGSGPIRCVGTCVLSCVVLTTMLRAESRPSDDRPPAFSIIKAMGRTWRGAHALATTLDACCVRAVPPSKMIICQEDNPSPFPRDPRSKMTNASTRKTGRIRSPTSYNTLRFAGACGEQGMANIPFPLTMIWFTSGAMPPEYL